MKKRKWRAEIRAWLTGGAEDARGIIRYCSHRRNPVASFCLRASTCMGPMSVPGGGAIERAGKRRGYLVPRTTCYLPVFSSTSPLIRTWLLKGDRIPGFFSPHTDDLLCSAMASRVIRQRYCMIKEIIFFSNFNLIFLLILSSIYFKLIYINYLNFIWIFAYKRFNNNRGFIERWFRDCTIILNTTPTTLQRSMSIFEEFD